MENRFTIFALFDSVIDTLPETLPPKEAACLCDAIKKYANEICLEYVKLTNRVKKKYMKNPDGRLDRHKCAAAFMIAILRKLEADVPKDPLFMERLAILAGLRVLGTFAVADKPSAANSKFIAFLKRKKGFLFPAPSRDAKEYEDNWAVELHHARAEKKLFILPLAHELFFIERYNRMLAGASRK